MTWTAPTYTTGVFDPDDYNAQVAGNLDHLHTGNGFWLPTPSQDLSAAPKATAVKLGAYLVPAIARDAMTLTRMAYRSDTANNHVDLGIFLDDGNGTTCSKVSTSGLVAMPSGAGPKAINLAQPAPILPYTKYWLALGFDAAGAAVLGTNGPLLGLARRAANCIPLPTVLTFDMITSADPAVAPRPFIPATSPCLAGLP